ncbi:MAG: ABC-type cobalt transport system, ATPase component [Haloquadratum sp. J07HQX50]|jgi:ABC-type cobalt transport system, ATPase component|nr:MAG: ABC-type cobalt transport system, ATPase component [Haloquadratum sp. J07HQX50]
MIQVENLTHRKGQTTVIDGISLKIDDGEWVVIAGANGSGKTTLIKHFNGLLSPDRGVVRINDTPVEADLLNARTTVGMVFQQPRDQLVAGTVAADVAFGPENLGLERNAIDTRVEQALETVGMSKKAQQRVHTLSGGEVARVALAGVLAMRPDHLICDEPFTGLDTTSRQAVYERLCEISASGTSIIIVTHDLREVIASADRLMILSDGQVGFNGAPTELPADDEQFNISLPTTPD